jgi:hypothetical protein
MVAVMVMAVMVMRVVMVVPLKWWRRRPTPTKRWSRQAGMKEGRKERKEGTEERNGRKE